MRFLKQTLFLGLILFGTINSRAGGDFFDDLNEINRRNAPVFEIALHQTNASEADAQKFYDLRNPTAEGIQNSLTAAEIYRDLAARSTTVELSARFLVHHSQALYYAADVEKNNEVKKARYQAAIDPMKLLLTKLERSRGEPNRNENAEILAKAYYWYGASSARKAEAEGILTSLNKWPELEEYMKFILEFHRRGLINQKNIEGYGANRVLGRAYFKIPRIFGGDMTKAETMQEEAFKKTLDENGEVSIIGLNNNFYAETLAKNGKAKQAKDILTSFIKYESHPEDLNPDRIPETIVDIQEAKEILKTLGK